MSVEDVHVNRQAQVSVPSASVMNKVLEEQGCKGLTWKVEEEGIVREGFPGQVEGSGTLGS